MTEGRTVAMSIVWGGTMTGGELSGRKNHGRSGCRYVNYLGRNNDGRGIGLGGKITEGRTVAMSIVWGGIMTGGDLAGYRILKLAH